MPDMNAGAGWDQGLQNLSQYLFRDPGSIAQAGYYGALQRKAQLEAQAAQRQQSAAGNVDQMLGPDTPGGPPASTAFAPPGAPPAAPPASPPAGAPMGAPAQLPGAAVAPPGTVPSPIGPLSSSDAAVKSTASLFAPAGVGPQHGIGTVGQPSSDKSSPAPNSGALPAPVTTGNDGSVPNNDPASGQIRGLEQPEGRIIRQAPPAQANGSPAPPAFSFGRLISQAVAAGYDGDKLRAIAGAGIIKMVNSNMLDQHTANQYLLDLNPQQAEDMQKQQYVTGATMTPAIDHTINKPVMVPYSTLVQNPQRYTALSPETYNTYQAPTRYYTPGQPFRQQTGTAYDVMSSGKMPVTAQGQQEFPAGVAGEGKVLSPAAAAPAVSGIGVSSPIPHLTPQEQQDNQKIDQQVVQQMFQPGNNPYEIKYPAALNDPQNLVSTKADQYQMNDYRLRYDRAAATTAAIRDLEQTGQIKRPSRQTTFTGRETPQMISQMQDANPNVATIQQVGKPPIKLFQIKVSPNAPGQGGQGGQGGGPQTMGGVFAPKPTGGPNRTPVASPQAAKTPPDGTVVQNKVTGEKRVWDHGTLRPLNAGEVARDRQQSQAMGRR